jgi:hypothetical protein
LTVNSNIVLATRPNVGGTGSVAGTLNINGGTVEATNIIGGGGVAKIAMNSGVLDLQGGQITNVTTLAIGDAVSPSALLTDAAGIHSPNPIVIAANGMLVGNTVLLTPSLLVSGGISPGDAAVGVIANSNDVTLDAGGRYICDMSDAVGQPGTNWDFLSVGGTLHIEAADTNPFVIQLRSLDLNLNDGNPGAADFGNQSSESWPIAAAVGGIAGFSADKFIVDTSGFQNDLAGGVFSVQTNGESLLLVFTSRPPPPVISSIAIVGTNLVVRGVGGVTGGHYFVLASANLALPVNQWQRLATNPFDSGGNFGFTNSLTPVATQTFYQLQLQWP